MPKPKKAQKPNLASYISDYNSASLVAALETLESSMAWKMYDAYTASVQRQYEITALDLMGKEQKGASYASGYAKCAEDMTKDFMEGLKATIRNVSPVIEDIRPDEEG